MVSSCFKSPESFRNTAAALCFRRQKALRGSGTQQLFAASSKASSGTQQLLPAFIVDIRALYCSHSNRTQQLLPAFVVKSPESFRNSAATLAALQFSENLRPHTIHGEIFKSKSIILQGDFIGNNSLRRYVRPSTSRTGADSDQPVCLALPQRKVLSQEIQGLLR